MVGFYCFEIGEWVGRGEEGLFWRWGGVEGGVEVDGCGDGEDIEIGGLGEGGLEGCVCCVGVEGGDGYGGGFVGVRVEEFEVEFEDVGVGGVGEMGGEGGIDFGGSVVVVEGWVWWLVFW